MTFVFPHIRLCKNNGATKTQRAHTKKRLVVYEYHEGRS